jgi:hypothetical protein
MQWEIRTEGVDFVVAHAPHPKNDHDGRQKADIRVTRNRRFS